MRINNISNNQNFNGIYRIKNTGNEKELVEKVLKPYIAIRHRHVMVQHGENIFTPMYAHDYETCCSQTGYAKDWLIMNAKNHGIDITEPKMDTLTIYTDTKDYDEVKAFIADQGKIAHPSFIDRLKSIFGTSNYKKEQDEIQRRYEELPKHLKPIFLSSETYKILTKRYEERFKDKIVDAESPKDLLIAMMNER